MPDARMDPVPGRAGGDSTQIQSHLNDTQEQLLDELADLLFQDPDGDVDTDQLDALLEKLDEADPLPEPPDPQESLEQFRRRHADLFAAMEAESAGTSVSSPEKKRSKHKLAKIAIVAIAAVLVLSVVSVQADWNFLDLATHIISGIFKVGGDSIDNAIIRIDPLEEGETASYSTLQEAVDAFGIDVPVVPTWVPDRFILEEVTASNQSGNILIYADYLSDDGAFQIRYNESVTSASSNIEIDEMESSNEEIYLVKGIKHHILRDLERKKAFWRNGELECRMTGAVSEEEIMQIIKSIYEGE